VNEKITLPGLTQLLALQTGDTKKQTEDFVKEFFNLISNTLASGDSVKIKEFGVFKTISVEARKSVNVSTGEEHEIPAHKKAVFVPSKEFAALVNEPFEMFETVELADDVTFDDKAVEDAAEDSFAETLPEETVVVSEEEDVITSGEPIVYSKQEQISAVEKEPAATAEQEPEESTLIVEKPQDPEEEPQVLDEKSVSTEMLSDSEDEDNVYTVDDVEESEPTPIASGTPGSPTATLAVTKLDSDTDADENPEVHAPVPHDYVDSFSEDDGLLKRKSRFGLGFLTGFVVAVFLGFVVYGCFFYVDWSQFGVDEKSLNEKKITTEVTTSTVPVGNSVSDNAVVVSKTEGSVNDGNTDQKQIAEQSTDVPNEDEVPTAPSDRKVYDTISKTRYLTTMAKDHYGNYNLWSVIYEENKSFLGHPDRIRPGTQVVIPPLSKYGVDPSNPADIAKAKKKGVEIYSRYK